MASRIPRRRQRDSRSKNRRREARRRCGAIDELRLGQPDYSQMSPALADVTRRQLPGLKSAIVQLVALQSVTFRGVGPGWPRYLRSKVPEWPDRISHRAGAGWKD